MINQVIKQGRMLRQIRNYEVTQLLDKSEISLNRLNFNQFGNFIYKDHVTRQMYEVNNLKKLPKKALHCRENSNLDKSSQNSILKHKSYKSVANMPRICEKDKQKSSIQARKYQLSHFLQQLVMMNQIRSKRNFIVSGNQKAQKRRSQLPSLLPSINHNINIDTLKQQVRKQVNSLNTEIFRQYMENQQPYRSVFNELNVASNTGALNSNKIRQIRQNIKQYSRMKDIQRGRDQAVVIKTKELDGKQNQKFDHYFDAAWKELDQQIHLRMKHQTGFNWKHAVQSTIVDMTQVNRERK